MKRIFNEQISDKDSHTAEADNGFGDDFKNISLEKFKDVSSLIKAYNCLEAEFTKRSQRLRQLEGECEALKAELKTKQDSFAGENDTHGETSAEDFIKRYPCAAEFADEIAAVVEGDRNATRESACIDILADRLKKQAELFGDRDFILSQIDGSIKDEIIREFLSGISGAKPKEIIGGEIVVTPPIKPKNLREAKLLAEKFFR